MRFVQSWRAPVQPPHGFDVDVHVGDVEGDGLFLGQGDAVDDALPIEDDFARTQQTGSRSAAGGHLGPAGLD